MRLNIYCDESTPKGEFYSRFYGGAVIKEQNRVYIEDRIMHKKEDTKLNGELKWTKVNAYNLDDYIQVVDEFFDLLHANLVKMRVMFSQNIYQVGHLEYDSNEAYLKLYYQFIKHAFGLSHCNPLADKDISVAVLLDEVPEKESNFIEFKKRVANLTNDSNFIRV